jgi:4-hydroxy-3-polyprenylbenzoate decarboxylase
MWRDLRLFIKFLEDQKSLIRIKKEVDAKFEISWVLRKMAKIGMPAALFENVTAREIPVVGNLYSTPKRVCQALGVPKDKIWLECFSTIHKTENPVPRMMQFARSNPVPHNEVRDGPVKEVIIKDSEIDLSRLPVPTWFEHDGGPYITSAVAIALNQKTRVFNAGVYRIQIVDKDKFF